MTSLGDRMKTYEQVSKTKLLSKVPVIMRVDGRAFHTYTKGFDRPFDVRIIYSMRQVAQDLVNEIQGAKIAYCQSDEVSILITDYDKRDTQGWFNYVIQKMASVSASIATIAFDKAMGHNASPFMQSPKRYAQFDSRVFNLPRGEVCNYFIWRQQDAVRNSISMLAQSHFSHKQLQRKKSSDMQDMLMDKFGINWNEIPTLQKRGWCVTRAGVDWEIPTFTEDRYYIEQHVNPDFVLDFTGE